MKTLVRTEVEKFELEEAITLEDLEKKKEKIKIISVQEIFKNLKNINLNSRKKELFLNGVQLTFDLQDGIYNIYSKDNKYIGLGIVKDKLLKRDVVI